MRDVLYYLQLLVKFWPLVNKVVGLVEKLKSDAPSEEKKAYAMELIMESLDLANLSEERKTKLLAVLSALVDLIVAIKNLLNSW